MDRLNKGVDATYRVHGKAAEYQVAGGDRSDVTIIPRQPDDSLKFGSSRASVPTMVFLVRVAEVGRPKKYDEVYFEGETYQVQSGAERDDLRFSWEVTAEQQ